MAVKFSGSWREEQVEQFLGDAVVPMRLSCLAKDGFPRVVSLWYQYRDGLLFGATHQSSKLVKLLQNDNRVGFEVAPDTPPYCGIRGQGSTTLSPLGDSELLQQLVQRYVGDNETDFTRWLISRSAEELVITVTPHRIYSWDYRSRMKSGD